MPSTRDLISKFKKKRNSGKLKTKTIELAPYFKHTFDGSPYANSKSRYQTRTVDVNLDFIEEKTNYVRSKYGDNIKSVDDVKEFDNLVIIENLNDDYYEVDPLGGGNHTAAIQYNVGLKESRADVIDFQEDCGGKSEVLHRICNLLNQTEKDRQSLSNADIRREFEKMMENREERGEDPTPTPEDIEDFLQTYPQISAKNIGQWKRYHPTIGGGREPLVSYSKQRLKDLHNLFQNSMEKYKDYVVLAPRQVPAYNVTGMAEMVHELSKEENEGRDKVLMLLYCKSQTQADEWQSGDTPKEVKDYFSKVSQRFSITLEFEMLSYE